MKQKLGSGRADRIGRRNSLSSTWQRIEQEMAGVPRCRSFQCNGDKADAARERVRSMRLQSAVVGAMAQVFTRRCECALLTIIRRTQAHRASPPRLLRLLTAVPAGMVLISTGIGHGVCLSDNLIARVAVVLQHAPACRAQPPTMPSSFHCVCGSDT